MPANKSKLIEYVIGKVPKEEYLRLSKGIDTGLEAVENILKKGIDNAMNFINAKN
jgi:peptidyl-tRNA hydrolase